jgi:hypothetical protein
MAGVRSIVKLLRRAFRLGSEAERGDAPGRYLPSEEFFDARSRALGPDGYDRVDVDRQFKKP